MFEAKLETVTTLKLIEQCTFLDLNGAVVKVEPVGKLCYCISGLLANTYYQTNIGPIYTSECEVIGIQEMTYEKYREKYL